MRSLCLGNDVILSVEKREGEGAGPAVHLIIRVPENPPSNDSPFFRNVWRGDLFKEKPHEHFFMLDGEEVTNLEGESALDPIAWCKQRLSALDEIILAAGYPQAADSIAHSDFASELETINGWIQEYAAT